MGRRIYPLPPSSPVVHSIRLIVFQYLHHDYGTTGAFHILEHSSRMPRPRTHLIAAQYQAPLFAVAKGHCFDKYVHFPRAIDEASPGPH